jgi:hypothetical protein
VAQRRGFREYLAGLLAPRERNKTLTALAGAEPVTGSKLPAVQRLQFFLSESVWDPEAVNDRRLELLLADPVTAPHGGGVLIIDDSGDRKDGTRTAHVGRQYLGRYGKTDSGVVTVTTVRADERVYYPVHAVPYTPAKYFAKGKNDPGFRTKLQIGADLAVRAQAAGFCFRAVVADSAYGDQDGFRAELAEAGLPFVMALRPHRGTWARAADAHTPVEAARVLAWGGPGDPGDWRPVTRTFRDGHAETWWAADASLGGWGPDGVRRLVVATADPGTLPDKATWYLVTNLARPGGPREKDSPWPAASLAEIVRLYGIRHWIEMVFTQLAKRAMRPVGRGRQDVADLDLVVGDDDAVDEQLGELPPLLEDGGGEAGADGLAECLDAAGDGLQFQLLPGGGVQLPLLGRQGGVAAVQLFTFALEFGQGDDLGQVGVEQPLLLAVELVQGLADDRLPGLEFLGQPGAPVCPVQRAGDVGGVGQQRAQVGPDQLIELPGRDVAGGAAPPFRRAQRVGAAAAQVVAVAGGALAAGARQPARAAADQRAQQVLVPGVTRRALLVGIQLGLHAGEGLLADDLRDRHLDPVLFRPRGLADAPASRPQRRLAAAGRRHPGAVGHGPAGIGRVAQDAPHAGHIPAWLAGRGSYPQIGQPGGELIQGGLRLQVPVEQLRDQRRFCGLCPDRGRVPGPVRVQAVAERRTGPRQQRARPQPGVPAAPHPLGDQRALVMPTA